MVFKPVFTVHSPISFLIDRNRLLLPSIMKR